MHTSVVPGGLRWIIPLHWSANLHPTHRRPPHTHKSCCRQFSEKLQTSSYVYYKAHFYRSTRLFGQRNRRLAQFSNYTTLSSLQLRSSDDHIHRHSHQITLIWVHILIKNLISHHAMHMKIDNDAEATTTRISQGTTRIILCLVDLILQISPLFVKKKHWTSSHK